MHLPMVLAHELYVSRVSGFSINMHISWIGLGLASNVSVKALGFASNVWFSIALDARCRVLGSALNISFYG